MNRPGLKKDVFSLQNISMVFFMLCLLWMSFAAGYITYFSDTFKFVPGFTLFSAALLLFIISITGKKQPLILFNSPMLILISAHVFFTIFPSIFWHQGYNEVYIICINLSIFCLAVLSINLFNTKARIRFLFFIFISILGTLSFCGILEYFGLILLKLNWGHNTIAVFLNNPNIYSGYLLLLLPAAYASFFLVKNKILKSAVAVISVMGFINLILAQSRAALIAHFLSIILFIIFYRKITHAANKSRGKVIIVIVLIAVVFTAFLFINPSLFAKIKRTFDFNDSRLTAYGIALKLWLRSPLTFLFGNGTGSFMPLYFTFKPEYYRAFTSVQGWDAVHNEYLELLVDGGIVSLGVFIFLCIFVIRKGYKIINNSSNPFFIRMLTLGCSLSVISLLTDGLFSTNMRVSVVIFLFYLFVSLIEALGDMCGDRSSVKLKAKMNLCPSGKSRLIAAGLIIVLLIPLNITFWKRFKTEHLMIKAVKQENTLEQKRSSLLNAEKNEPDNVYPHYMLAKHYILTKKYKDFYNEAFLTNRIISNFRDIVFLDGTVKTAQARYLEAEKSLAYFLQTDQYNRTAELYQLFVYIKLNDRDNATEIFKEIVTGDFLLSDYRDTVLYFPVKSELVKRVKGDADDTFIFGTEGMNMFLESLSKDPDLNINLFKYRFNYFTGQIYLKTGFTDIALKVLTEALNTAARFNFAQDIKQYSENKIRDNPDLDKYISSVITVKQILENKIEKARKHGSLAEEAGALASYIKLFDDENKTVRLKKIYIKQRMFKAAKKLEKKTGAF